MRLERRFVITHLVSLIGIAAVVLAATDSSAQRRERWQDAEPYGLFFNDYDPNFYTGWVPRAQERDRIDIHLGRGNQLRVRLVLSDEAVDNYLTDQAAKHALYKEVVDSGRITLTSNLAWEAYDAKFQEEGIAALAAKRGQVSAAEWRAMNVAAIDRLNPERLYRIQKDFGAMADAWAGVLRAAAPAATPAATADGDTADKAESGLDLEAKLDLVNALFPYRLFLDDLTPERDAAFAELMALAQTGDSAAFRAKARPFFDDITKGIYDIDDGKIDYYEYTAIWAAGTYDTTTRWNGKQIPMITTPGIWRFEPRMHGNGMVGMVDYISAAGYYGLIPMFPYEYGGGNAYNSIHNTGISNWIQGHPLLPTEWKNYTDGSRSGKPYNRVALTSRGPVSHGCTRLNSGHLAELRELLPSVSKDMEGIPNFRNVSHCYDVFDRHGDGKPEIMGVQYYIAFRHTKSRVAKEIWSQNNRKDFYDWMYGNEMNYGPVGSVTFDEVCTGKFVKRKAREGQKYQGLSLYEAPHQPETVQFYKIKGLGNTSHPAMDFNRELRRVGYGYEVDRKMLGLP